MGTAAALPGGSDKKWVHLNPIISGVTRLVSHESKCKKKIVRVAKIELVHLVKTLPFQKFGFQKLQNVFHYLFAAMKNPHPICYKLCFN